VIFEYFRKPKKKYPYNRFKYLSRKAIEGDVYFHTAKFRSKEKIYVYKLINNEWVFERMFKY